MSLNVSERTEARITEVARRMGVSVDTLLERFINEHAAGAAHDSLKPPELPVWHLGAIGSLHRRDIYNDVP